MVRIALSLLLVSSAFCQNVERVFRLTHTPAATGQNEIATTIRTVGQIQKVSVDPVAATMTVQGSATQIALAEWLVPRLDAGIPGPQSYNVAGNPNDMIVVYPLVNIRDMTSLQEIITTVRTVLDLQLVYNISSSRTLTLRGTANQMAAVDFALPKLDQAGEQRQAASSEHFHVNGALRGFDTLSVYRLGSAKGQLAIQEVITNLRTVTDLMKIYNVTSNATLSMEASQSDIQVAEWVIERLDRLSPDPSQTELKMPNGKDDVIHVFYLSSINTGKNINELYKAMREATHITKAYWITVPSAIVMRGTADSIAIAGRMVAQADNQK